MVQIVCVSCIMSCNSNIKNTWVGWLYNTWIHTKTFHLLHQHGLINKIWCRMKCCFDDKFIPETIFAAGFRWEIIRYFTYLSYQDHLFAIWKNFENGRHTLPTYHQYFETKNLSSLTLVLVRVWLVWHDRAHSKINSVNTSKSDF